MDTDDEKLEQKQIETLDLEAMSIEALAEYVDDLHSEIKRVESEIRLKKDARRGAEKFFQ